MLFIRPAELTFNVYLLMCYNGNVQRYLIQMAAFICETIQRYVYNKLRDEGGKLVNNIVRLRVIADILVSK